ncbi:hypothetical protein VTK73DRAFT_4659 [Phialemonium thermophilum]|uniref:Uncharacterized protein n=1 Tax=Phialemonium thermophilum TaxID=223376 RepID=A0ABR3V714_9PEZI
MQLSADGGGNGGEGGGGGSTEAARRPLDERDVEDLVRGLYGLRGWGQSLRDIKTAAEYYGGAAYRERHFRAHRSWKSSAGWGGRHSSSSGQGHSRVGSHYLPKGGDGDGGDGGNDEETSKSGDMFESLASAAPNFLNDASSYDLSTVSGPLPYRSLLSPVDDDDDPSCQGGSSSAPSRPPPPPYSSSLDAPSPRPCREVEMSISSRFKNGFFGRLRRANKGDTTPSS